MASAQEQTFRIGSWETPILLRFRSSVSSTATPCLQIDSRSTGHLLGIHLPVYTMSVTLDARDQTLFVSEAIFGPVIDNAAFGTLRVTFSELENPNILHHASNDKNYVRLSFTLRQSVRLTAKHYRSGVCGTWSNTMRQKLQMYNIQDRADETRSIEITLLSAPKGVLEIRAEIEKVFGLAKVVSKSIPTLVSASTPLLKEETVQIIKSLGDEVKVLQTHVGSTQSDAVTLQQLVDAAEGKPQAMQEKVQKAKDDLASSGPSMRACSLPTNTEATDLGKAEGHTIYDTAPEPTASDCAEMVKLHDQVRGLKKQNSTLEDAIRGLKQRLEIGAITVQQVGSRDTPVDLLDLESEFDIPGEFAPLTPMSTPVGNKYSNSDKPQSFQIVSDHARDQDSSSTIMEESGNGLKSITQCHSHITLDEIHHIHEAVQTVARIQEKALRSGKAVTMEIREAEDMANWLAERDSKLIVKSIEGRRALAMLWL